MDAERVRRKTRSPKPEDRKKAEIRGPKAAHRPQLLEWRSLEPAGRMHNEGAKTQTRRDYSDRYSQDDAPDCVGRAFESRSGPFRLDVPRGCA